MDSHQRASRAGPFLPGQSKLLIESAGDVQEDVARIDLRVMLEKRTAGAMSALASDPLPYLEARRVIERTREPVHHFRCFIGLLDSVGDNSPLPNRDTEVTLNRGHVVEQQFYGALTGSLSESGNE